MEEEVTLFLFLLLALGVARVTWFISEDHLPLIARPREAIVNRNPDGNLAYLINCWWCVSVYTGAGAAAFAVWVLQARMTFWWDTNPVRPPTILVDWKEFLLLWPALSVAGVMLMGAADWLTSAPDED